MQSFYTLIISFLLIFLSELGDKTQILVLSFSTKLKTLTILIGVALGSFFSHGLAILFGSVLGNTESLVLHQILEFVTYASFILVGLISFLPKNDKKEKPKNSVLNKINRFKLNYIIMIAFSIAIGEFGDKTFLASIGLGIAGMCASDLIAIILGKFLNTKIPAKGVETLSSILFLLFGVIGLIRFFL